jgi:hypothetical protein
MSVVTIGVSVALWLRIRAVNGQNTTLREALSTLEEERAKQPDSDEIARQWLQAKIDVLDPTDDLTPMVDRVLRQQIEPSEDFAEAVRGLVAPPTTEAGLVDADIDALLNDVSADEPAAPAPVSSDEAGRVALLEAQLEEALAEINTLKSLTEEDEPEELKALLQQFTRDSREMMACIQALEKENAELRAQLGLEEPSSSQSDAA